MKPFIVSLAIVASLFWAFEAHAQTPITNQQRNIIPALDSQYYLGTTTGATGLRAWLRVIADSFYDTDASDGCAQWVSNVLTSTGSDCGTGSGGAGGGLGTTTPWTTGNLVRVVNNSSVTSIATSSLGLGVSSFLSPNISQWTNDAGYSAFAWPFTRLSTNEQATSTVMAFLGGLISTASSTVNLVQTPNLTSNGFVKTSGGNGVLSVDTTTYESGLTAGDGLTRTVNDFDCDTASGSVFGCLSSADWTTFNTKLGSYDAFPLRPSYGGSGTTSLVTFNDGILTSNASSTIYKFSSVFSTTTNATATDFHISSNLNFGGVSGSAWSTFCTAITGGAGLCDGDDATGGGGSSFAFPFTLLSTGEQATSTTLALLNGFVSTASSTLTSFTATNATTSSFGVTGLTNCNTIDTDASGYFVCGTDATGGGGGEPYPFPLATNATSSTVGFFGGLLSTASSTFTGSTTLATTLMTNATSTNLAVTNGFAVSGITSAIPITNAVGEFAEYAGTSCTNQFVRSLSALGVATCASVANTDLTNSTISGIALGSNLADLTAGTGLTSAGTYNGGTARTFSLDQTTNLAWTGQLDFGGASFLEIPNGANPTANDVGEIAHDTTDNQLILDDFVVGKATERIWGVTVASTSPYFIQGTNLAVPTQLDGYTMTSIKCHVTSGTSKAIIITDGTNATESITCGTTVTADDGTITNASVTADEIMYIDFGATSGAVDTVSISVFGQWTRE